MLDLILVQKPHVKGRNVIEVANDHSFDLLMESGVFERHWYMAQCGVYFHNSRVAAQHFLEFGMAQSASPHPLMDPRAWPRHLQEAWRRGDLRGVLAYFRKPLALQPPLGSIVVPNRLDVPELAVREHAGGTLGWLLDCAGDDFVVPTRAGDRVLGDLRRSWRSIYELLKRQNRLTQARNTPKWNDELELSWRASMADVGVPADGDVPLVSIVMPAWNRAHVIAQAIRSVQAQGLRSWELIVVDDGSEDQSRDLVRTMMQSDERIHLIEVPHGGVCAARNVGIETARGRWVAFLDTDNQWQADYLDLMVRGMVRGQARIAYAGLELRNGAVVQYRAFTGGLDHLQVLNHIDLNVVMLERELALQVPFDAKLRRWVDHDFVIRAAKIAEPVLFPFIGCRYNDDQDNLDRISTSETDAWQWVVLGKNIVDWNLNSSDERIPGRVSVVMPVYQDWQLTVEAVESVLATTLELDVEVVLVDNGSAHHVTATLMQLYSFHSKVKYSRLSRNMNFAIGSNYGASISTGEYICFLNNDTQVRDHWLPPLLEKLQESSILGVQPLLLYPDDSIQSAGTVFLADKATPAPFLKGHPPEEALGAETEEFSAVTAACLLMRFDDVKNLHGFDPIFINGMEDIDLCLRAQRQLSGHFAMVPRSRVTHHESKTPGRGKKIKENREIFMDRWSGFLPTPETDKYERLGLRISSLGGDQAWIPAAVPVVVREPTQAVTRWGIRYSSIGGPRGDRWGDTFFVESLAAALRENGQQVVTYRHGAHASDTRPLDDINLVVRGLDKVHPIPGMTNILWVISHPEDVTLEELRAYDLVYSASAFWASLMARRAGREVLTLLQATDARIFHPEMDGGNYTLRPPTFVGGNFRDRTRKIVEDALVSGIDMRVIGHGWSGLPDQIFEAPRIENSRLGDVYRRSSRVLADHWPDMAAGGFIQNRLFDAAACGVPVITDPVLGLEEVFGSIVQTYDGPGELRYLCSEVGLRRFGSLEERKEQAQDIVRNHSFDARARVLVRDAVEFRNESPDKGNRAMAGRL